MRRRASIMIDMEVSTAPPTRRPSPTRDGKLTAVKEELPSLAAGEKADTDDLVARKAGLGSLMKSAKQDVQVAEFDMSAFF